MTLHFTIGCWILLFLTPGYTPVFVKDEVIGVPRGLDAALRCRSKRSFLPKWEWDSNQTSSNIKTLVVNSTAYLLVENFQKMNEGLYYCINGTGKTAVKLEIQLGVKDTMPVYRISRIGSLHLFCEPQSGAALEGLWSWRQTGSEGDCKRSGSDLEHFGNRSEVKNGSDNKFSLSISPLLWNDSGQYQCTLCNGTKPYRQCTYEIITVKVYSEPVELTEGEDGSLVCAVSRAKNSTRLLWIDTQSNRMFSGPEARAPAGNHLIYLSLVCLSGLLISVGTAFIIYRCRRHQDPIQPPPPTLLPTQPSAKGDEQTPDDDGAVHYAAVNFKRKKAADSSTSAALATDNLTPEEDSVIYADVALATRIRR